MTPTDPVPPNVIIEKAHGPDYNRTRVALCLTLALPVLAGYLWAQLSLTPFQREYLPEYLRASLRMSFDKLHDRQSPNYQPDIGDYRLLRMEDNGRELLARERDVVFESASGSLHPLPSPEAYKRGVAWIAWVKYKDLYTEKLCTRFLRPVYGGRTASAIFGVPMFISFGGALLLAAVAYRRDKRRDTLERQGIWRRGSRRVTRPEFNLIHNSDGITIITADEPSREEKAFAAQHRKELHYPPGVVAIPKKVEMQHCLILGDTGKGKSTILRQYLRQIEGRKEIAVVYDPAGEFLAEFYDPGRGDIILNPLDERCPYWSPSEELATDAEALSLAQSMFPNDDRNNQFFVDAPRAIFAHLIQFRSDNGDRVTPQDLSHWLANPEEIDKRVYGTELHHMISKAAPTQREGVLASLSKIGHSIRLLPPNDQTARKWTAREWVKKRQGWVFVTTTPTTRTAQMPLLEGIDWRRPICTSAPAVAV